MLAQFYFASKNEKIPHYEVFFLLCFVLFRSCLCYTRIVSNAELIKYWIDSAQQDWNTTQVLLKSHRYMHALFFCHLTLEKTLKSIIANKKLTPPITHDLLLLAEIADIELNVEKAQLLSDVNAFNIRARYDDYKNSFYKRATASYTKKYIGKVNRFKIWLKKQ